MKNGEGYFKANNGDQINATYDGFAVPIPGTSNAAVKMFVTITGGTGKYADASGFLLITAIQTLPEGAATCTFDGVIDY